MGTLARTLIALVAVGCSTADGSTGTSNDPATDGCATNSVPMLVKFSAGYASDQFVPVTVDGTQGYFTIDTGSSSTFVYGPDDHTARYEVAIGCETVNVIRRDFAPSVAFGKPVLGVLGADFLRAVTTDFDYPGGKIVRHHGVPPTGTEGYLTVPIVDASGHIAVEAKVDGASKLLMVDTGSPHVVLAWTEGRPDDQAVNVEDINGTLIPAYLGDSDVSLESETKRIPVYRIPSWPYFQSFAKKLHPDLAGLYGRSSLGYRRIIIDNSASVLEFGPIQPIPAAAESSSNDAAQVDLGGAALESRPLSAHDAPPPP
ncbi:hypothetical protein AKJ09_06307 [Labilithrix luteola]|uniref:Aspartyl protease n=1 Tax=Labilithrix luteola TaxID=1391654 RepID=A0A0K1Q1I9_9BACT|nr:hypothetical protein [Labilithrix luteola]AKU99643.1 hypothetical protein AKJ09_06307 [Labilithrix luteola]